MCSWNLPTATWHWISRMGNSVRRANDRPQDLLRCRLYSDDCLNVGKALGTCVLCTNLRAQKQYNFQVEDIVLLCTLCHHMLANHRFHLWVSPVFPHSKILESAYPRKLRQTSCQLSSVSICKRWQRCDDPCSPSTKAL